MSMSMNIHGAAGITLGRIECYDRTDGSTFYTRSISIIDKAGKELIRIDPFSDDGYKLLVVDSELAEMNAELPLLKAA